LNIPQRINELKKAAKFQGSGGFIFGEIYGENSRQKFLLQNENPPVIIPIKPHPGRRVLYFTIFNYCRVYIRKPPDVKKGGYFYEY